MSEQRLRDLLKDLGQVAVAVSGGVDSMTLAVLASRTLGAGATLFHAVSPAVPPAATERVQRVAGRESWDLRLVDAGEMRDPSYLRNPYRRCFHCKTNLYATLARETGRVILSGTNLDDLGDFRPGLDAARDHGVRHPFVECGMDKAGIRRLCADMGYPNLARLPAAPCLSSRIQTGLAIDARVLTLVDQVETELRSNLQAEVVRCRIERDTIAVQMDVGDLSSLDEPARADIRRRILALAAPLGLPETVRFEPYRMGSAFRPDA